MSRVCIREYNPLTFLFLHFYIFTFYFFYIYIFIYLYFFIFIFFHFLTIYCRGDGLDVRPALAGEFTKVFKKSRKKKREKKEKKERKKEKKKKIIVPPNYFPPSSSESFLQQQTRLHTSRRIGRCYSCRHFYATSTSFETTFWSCRVRIYIFTERGKKGEGERERGEKDKY